MTAPPRPVFVLSLPRSGSTLLQRLLATHPQVATTAEPWLLLPLLSTLRRSGVYADYGHRSMVRAVQDFYEGLEDGRAAYLARIREFALALYADAADGAPVFVDKTPRYHLVVDELMEAFPDGRFVVLWRNPVAVASSIIESFGRGHWNLEKYSVDLVEGVENLTRATSTGDPRVYAIRYEDLVDDPDRVVGAVLEHMGLEPLGSPVSLSIERSGGRMGDRTGHVRYPAITREPVDKWRDTMAATYRRRWALRYLRGLGPDKIQAMGYDYHELVRDVRELRAGPRGLGSDLARTLHGRVQRTIGRRLTTPSAAELRRTSVTATGADRQVSPSPETQPAPKI